jgi:CheY-like chemotaxis protein
MFKPKVLLIEANALVRVNLSMRMRRAQYEVVSVTNVNAALNRLIAEEGSFTGIVVDNKPLLEADGLVSEHALSILLQNARGHVRKIYVLRAEKSAIRAPSSSSKSTEIVYYDKEDVISGKIPLTFSEG